MALAMANSGGKFSGPEPEANNKRRWLGINRLNPNELLPRVNYIRTVVPQRVVFLLGS
jgi:hypothetical protein